MRDRRETVEAIREGKEPVELSELLACAEYYSSNRPDLLLAPLVLELTRRIVVLNRHVAEAQRLAVEAKLKAQDCAMWHSKC